jgi:hypothetical protein
MTTTLTCLADKGSRHGYVRRIFQSHTIDLHCIYPRQRMGERDCTHARRSRRIRRRSSGASLTSRIRVRFLDFSARKYLIFLT